MQSLIGQHNLRSAKWNTLNQSGERFQASASALTRTIYHASVHMPSESGGFSKRIFDLENTRTHQEMR